MAAEARGRHHKIVHCIIIGSKLPVIFCSECGGFTSGRGPPKLLGNCLRKMSSELRKLQKQELPGSGGLRISDPVHRSVPNVSADSPMR
eukprot:4171146-Pyramimonas_sp.AAC.1